MMTEVNGGNSISSNIEQNDSYNIDGIAEKLQNSFIDDAAEQSHYKSHCDRSQCRSPIEYNDVNHLFHIDFMRSIQSIPVRQKRFFVAFKIAICFFFKCYFHQFNYLTGIKMEPASVVPSAMKKCVKSNAKIRFY